MKKENYNTIEIEIIDFNKNDIIVASITVGGDVCVKDA